MKYVVIKPPPSMINIEKYVIDAINKAIDETTGLIVLDLGENFVYNSSILSYTLVHRNRVVIINASEKFKALMKILKADKLVCVVDTIDEFANKCTPMNPTDCEACKRNKGICINT